MRCVVMLCLLLVACEGPQGPVGPPGPQGKGGLALDVTYRCFGIATVASGTSFSLNHDVYAFTDGSVMASCQVGGSLAESTGVSFFKAIQNGSVTGACSVTFDADLASTGYWRFEISQDHAHSVATYNDSGSANDRRQYSIVCSAFR